MKCPVVELVKNALRVNRGIFAVGHEISLRLRRLQKSQLPLVDCSLFRLFPFPFLLPLFIREWGQVVSPAHFVMR